MTYNFSATQNNGRTVSSADAVTGENVSYTYDSLNRLIAAATTNSAGPMWGESYSHDEFGNLTAKVGTGGAPTVTPQVNSATNQVSPGGDNGFDANGNWLGTGVIQANNTPQRKRGQRKRGQTHFRESSQCVLHTNWHVPSSALRAA